ncbi:hypothetical protein [Conchiformibius steedae]|uniref:Uncharacterized protein n=1 Tax=Conchiformibius steedae TaxID=153493 RepID=A0A3P2AAD0_9NEIS|nr:hypothetical protein [Conchiformibius steedae]RRD91200.1 hypothetical protein EII21_02060 [Conchiformibius steedae]
MEVVLVAMIIVVIILIYFAAAIGLYGVAGLWIIGRVFFYLSSFYRIRKPVLSRGWDIYAAVGAYGLFAAVAADIAVLGASVRANHDVLALRTLYSALFWTALVWANLPLLPLLWQRRRIVATNIYLLRAWRCWLWLAGAMVAAILLGALAHIPSWGKIYGEFLATMYFWRSGLHHWLEADSVRTAADFAVPALRYGGAWLVDICCLVMMLLPWLGFVSMALSPEPRSSAPKGKYIIRRK